ncbi:BatA domain-containing protein [Rufibacter sediminis]|uniref:BatA domain-containing protein n=1 Tax=Rufibacter sediminis TaxID=2762756 RepID=A0ABR6VUL7_9BACT|nr:BatA domain-containing protein [Rufibacter sediminis]MBC3540594.1 BatA domain-containing protein [Rufibacter sediminis]
MDGADQFCDALYVLPFESAFLVLFQFLNPAWLWAAASVAVPIAIHLWNKKPPRTVLVGSIRWLQPSESKKLSSLRLSEPWLLLLRCLLLVLLALLLAEPRWKHHVPAVPEKHAYLHPALFQPRYLPQIAATVDSLALKGWQIHRLQPGFPKLPLNEETSLQNFQTDSLSADSTNAWAMLRVLNRSLPADARAWIFTTDLLRHHRGEFPALRSGLTWIPVSAPQTNTWLQEAYYTTAGQLLLRFGKSDGQEVTFLERKVAKPVSGQTITVPHAPAVQFTSHATSDSLTLMDAAQNTIGLSKQPLQVLVRYGKSRQADVRYVRAALQTALDYQGAAYQLLVSSEDQALPDSAPDWVFWLSDEPLAPFLARFPEKRLKTLQDAPGGVPVQKTESWAQVPGSAQPVSLHQRTSAPQTLAVDVLWKDGFGQPLLTQEIKDQQTHYRFYSRFHPTWNALPNNGHFPELLLRLLFPQETSWRTQFDTRTLQQDLERPRPFTGPIPENSPKTEELLDIEPWLVALMAVLLTLERWLATRRTRISA